MNFSDATLLDAAIVLVILVFVLAGVRRGLLRAGGALVGFVIGVMVSLAVAPWIAAQLENQALRFVLVGAAVVLLLSLCSGLGARIGGVIRRAVDFRPVRFLDGLAGGALHAGMALLFLSVAVFGASSLGISSVSRTVATSPVLSGIQQNTPTQLQALYAQLRSPAIASTIPQITGQALPGSVKAGADSSAATEAVTAASASVVRVSGVAAQCSQSQYGSGFVVAQDRVVTNAHVVAGVGDVVVEIPGSEAVSGTVVYYDAAKDLAVIATDGLQAAPLPVSEGATTGQSVAFAGYPLGGPLAIRAAAVQGTSSVSIQSDGATTPHALQVYSLSGNIQQGNSGGPLLNLDGEIVGAVFAKSTSQANVGYALTMDEVGPVIEAAASLTQPVDVGSCSTS